MPTLIC